VARVSTEEAARERVVLLACEAEMATLEALLRPHRVETVRMSASELARSVGDLSISAAVVAEDHLSKEDLALLAGALGPNRAFHDLPIVLVVDRSHLRGADQLKALGQLRLVERPIDAGILSASLQSAFRSRQNQRRGWQFEQRADEAEEQHRQRTEWLEANVAEQIADLRALSARLAAEVEERKRTEELLRESEELYRYTVELSQQMVWTADPEGRYTTAGGNFYVLTGAPEGMPFQEALPRLVHPDDYERLEQGWQDAFRTGQPHYEEFRMRVADGSYRIFQARAAPQRNENGEITRWYGFVEDVTEQRQATAALREAEERYRLAARATNDAVWDWDIASGSLTWSEAATVYLGNLPLDGCTIDWWEEAIHPDDRERVASGLRAVVEEGKSRWSAAYRLRKADGDYAYVYDRGFIIRDGDGRAIRAVGAVVDLTERRRAEAELRRTQAELIHVSRVSAMGTMASTLAHELNQPLTAVTSYVRGSRRLLADMDDDRVRQVCEALEFAEAGALRAGQIVRRLREMVARGTVAVGPEDLRKLIEDASVLAFVDAHLHGIEHRIEIDREARWVEADRIQIQQVLINLIRNAVQALQHAERREVVISARLSGEDMVEISVADSGDGIAETVRDALFSPFHSTKAEGMGIGLSISRTIVEAHHGRIWAEDGPDGGAIFRFTLPRAEELPEYGGLEVERLRAV
jgi:two-component system sensor kinase FixL